MCHIVAKNSNSASKIGIDEHLKMMRNENQANIYLFWDESDDVSQS